MLTTKHLATTSDSTTRTETKSKPVTVIDYTVNTSGVDLNDQVLSNNLFHSLNKITDNKTMALKASVVARCVSDMLKGEGLSYPFTLYQHCSVSGV
ncbi:hypothetical protein RRG08_008462 [Elysia crispata]|uniref:Uncharacterized protein n=1 Tax=Elysia crispata TaxID=231223 RepID=A0AAE1B315_9GAST|nr:hypothetical protein RRG08_008462 [Elysia crispata]